MNRTKIEWTQWTWNPITGCKHGCWYCYARKLAKRFKKIFPNGFEPTFHPERLKEPWEVKKPSKVFVCSIADLFAPWTPEKWREQVVDSMLGCPVKHSFQLLTKNPERIPDVLYPANWWIGTTVTNEGRMEWLNIVNILKVEAKVKFVSFEPLLGENHFPLAGLDWIIIGKLTGSRKVKLNPEWVWKIVDEAKKYQIPVFMKNNLVPVIPKGEIIQEFPEGV